MSKPIRSWIFAGDETTWLLDRTGQHFLESVTEKPPSFNTGTPCSQKDYLTCTPTSKTQASLTSKEQIELGFVYRALKQAIGLEVAISALVQLTYRKLSAAIERSEALNENEVNGAFLLPVPVHHLELRDIVHTLVFPMTELKFFKRWLKTRDKAVESLDDWTVPGGDQELKVDVLKERFALLEERIKKSHERCWTQWSLMNPKAKPKVIPLQTLSDIGFNARLLTGNISPALLLPLQRLPLPADPSQNSIDLVSSLFRPTQPQITNSRLTIDIAAVLGSKREVKRSRRSLDQLTDQSEDEKRKRNDAVKAKLRDIGQDFAKELGTSKPLSDKNKTKLLEMRHAWHTEQLFDIDSPALLGLDWVGKLMLDGTILPATAQAYLRTTIIGLAVDQANQKSMDQWDQDVVDNMFLEITDRRQYADKTIQRDSHLASAFLKYVKSKGFLQGVKIPWVKLEYMAIEYRNHLLCPEKVHYLIEQLALLDIFECDIAWVMTLLGFYGALRPGESVLLSIADVLIVATVATATSAPNCKQYEVWIDIKDGKTTSAARKVPLHALVPERLLQVLIKFVEERKGTFEGTQDWRHVALIGSPGEPQPLDQSYASNTAIKILRSQFGDYVDLHMLRHNGASYNLVRSQALTNKQITAAYGVAFPTLFKPALQGKLRDHLSWGRLTGFEQQTHHMVELARITGHASIESTSETYLHSVHIASIAALLG